jgi:murein L,D-transpeptidase YcbB/YkuD
MANYVLRNDASWDSVKIHEAMNSTEEKWVKLKKQEPVLITYLTTWVDGSGKLNIREDIYGHDETAIARLFNSETVLIKSI